MAVKTQANGNPESRRHRRILSKLHKMYPHAECALRFANPFELLVATILSAQSTDKTVNQITPALFAKYLTPAAMAQADLTELEKLIRSSGFFHNKAKSLQATAAVITNEHHGELPRTMEALIKLPGVGRKTANVVLNVAFGEPTMAVDTHIFRVSNRTGLAPGKTPLAVELGLLDRVPGPYLVDAHHWLILHGRYVCQARKPLCNVCAVIDECDYGRHLKSAAAA